MIWGKLFCCDSCSADTSLQTLLSKAVLKVRTSDPFLGIRDGCLPAHWLTPFPMKRTQTASPFGPSAWSPGAPEKPSMLDFPSQASTRVYVQVCFEQVHYLFRYLLHVQVIRISKKKHYNTTISKQTLNKPFIANPRGSQLSACIPVAAAAWSGNQSHHLSA